MAWECGIDGCGAVFEDVESAVIHQATEHERPECKVCGTIVPDGYLALRHTFNEHSRAEYVRAYGADSEDVRKREELLEEIEEVADMELIANELTR
ncbi:MULTISPECIES: hypothetical protein [Natrialba]|uniref:C2H2-type domain-containing protein n=1 Tax=Natrialba swarupiae TaxID=2448032 RepID=A0A5D5APP2_9EURY|nr:MULTISPECIES: hypothetical protein [Natrialba]MWV39537.1 hypothetical protein [Natrialba sp. INN-245]TYT62993.1 hypothetical protein FYC77_04930 [Natrialba swarupiae]